MKEQKGMSFPAIGGSSLLVIFAVLCLVVFSLLSLNTVLAEKRISEASAQATADWYAADLRAQEIFARLRAGEQVPGVEQTEARFVYSVPVSGYQILQVTLEKSSSGWEVISWKAVACPEEVTETLPVWQGLH